MQERGRVWCFYTIFLAVKQLCSVILNLKLASLDLR